MSRILSTLCILALCGAVSSTARGVEIPVNTTEDTIANDGACSLREAVRSVNLEQPSGEGPDECPAGEPDAIDVIVLPEGVFRLTLGRPGDDDNEGGDLDIRRSAIIAGAGRELSIIENGIGSEDQAGDGDRLLHVDPDNAGGVHVTLIGVSLEEGDVSCDGAGCEPGASAVEVSSGRLEFVDSAVRRNRSICRGDSCGSAGGSGAIRVSQGGTLSLLRSFLEKTVRKTTATAMRPTA